MARVLVTGANGFAGSAICRHLLARGWTVRGSVRRAEAPVAEGVAKVVSGPLDGATDWQDALAGVDAVVHCAARVHVLRETDSDPPAAFRRVNVDATRHLARQAIAAKVSRFVFLSSVGAMVPVMLRPPLIYGRDAPGSFALLARLVARGWPLPLASLDNRRSPLFVGNLAGAVEAALAGAATPTAPLALCDGENVSTAELARRIGRACGQAPRLLPCPLGLLRLAGRLLGRGAAVEALTGSLTVSNAEIATALGWSPRYTLDEGLALTFREAA